MTLEAANNLNITVAVLDTPNNPAVQISSTAPHITGSFTDREKIRSLGEQCDVITVEIEHVDATTLSEIEKNGSASVHPSPRTISIIQDKFKQKVHISKYNVPLPRFEEILVRPQLSEFDIIRRIAEVESTFETNNKPFGYPLMLKTKTQAYDGRGNRVIKSCDDIADAVNELGGGSSKNGPQLYVEEWVHFEKEIAVMVVRGLDGQVVSYPCVETIQQNNICHAVLAPAQIDGLICERARKVAEKAIESFDGAGVFGVEMFLLNNGTFSKIYCYSILINFKYVTGEILLNEIAPRPHNSGHYTIEACETSQFEQHLRSILGMPLGSTKMKVPAAAMVNILGLGSGDEGLELTLKPCQVAMSNQDQQYIYMANLNVELGVKWVTSPLLEIRCQRF